MSAEPKVKVLLEFDGDGDSLRVIHHPKGYLEIEERIGTRWGWWRPNPDTVNPEAVAIAVYSALEARHARVREALVGLLAEATEAREWFDGMWQQGEHKITHVWTAAAFDKARAALEDR